MAVDFDALVGKAVLDQFAEAVSYNPLASSPGAPAFGTRGIFDADHELIFEAIPASEDKAPGHNTTAPVLGVRSAELGLEPKQGDRVTIRGIVYAVWSVHPDGDGWFDLILRKRI